MTTGAPARPGARESPGPCGERRRKGAGGVFAVLLAETEQSGLCADDGELLMTLKVKE